MLFRSCKEHKLENMIDVKSKRCIHPNCLKQPHFNLPNEIKRLFCSDHKLENMINIKSLKCEKCSKFPSYNYPGETKGKFCKDHKDGNMINVIRKTDNVTNVLLENKNADIDYHTLLRESPIPFSQNIMYRIENEMN